MCSSPEELAEQLFEEAMALDDEGQTDLALQKYQEALQLDPSRATTNYNIGLIYKYRLQWQESLHYNQRACELNPEDEAANWNLAIAATALGDWKSARQVWHRLGLPIEEGDEPIEADFGITPLRLNPEEDAEVVWGRRIDPVRARIFSIPLSKSGFGHWDLVLHDGARVGEREYQGRVYPVFNVLMGLEVSDYATYEAEFTLSCQEDFESLKEMCEEKDILCEDWTTSINMVCKQCSEGLVHKQHDHEHDKQWTDRHQVGIATRDEQTLRQVLENWETPARKLESLELTLPATSEENQ